MLQTNFNKEVPQRPAEGPSTKVDKALLDQSIKDKEKAIKSNQIVRK